MLKFSPTLAVLISLAIIIPACGGGPQLVTVAVTSTPPAAPVASPTPAPAARQPGNTILPPLTPVSMRVATPTAFYRVVTPSPVSMQVLTPTPVPALPPHADAPTIDSYPSPHGNADAAADSYLYPHGNSDTPNADAAADSYPGPHGNSDTPDADAAAAPQHAEHKVAERELPRPVPPNPGIALGHRRNN